MPVTANYPAPYAPPATILDLINRFRERGMQTPFNADVLSRAGVADSLISRTFQSLRVLDLVDEQGMPTAALEGLRRATSDEYQTRLADWLRAAYSEVFQFADPSKDDPGRIRDAFRSYEPVGQQGRMVTLFLTLCQAAGIRGDSDGTPTPRPRAVRRDRQGSSAGSALRRDAGAAKPKRDEANSATKLPDPIAGLLASLPASGHWTKSRRDDFLRTFTAVLDFCVATVEADDRGEVDDDESE
jgi:hypothetical protein